MNILEEDFRRASDELGIPLHQASALWENLRSSESAPATKSTFDFVNLLYYFGAVIVMGAFGWFMTTAWDAFGDAGLIGIALAYAIAFLLGGEALWKRELRTPGGLLVTLAVCMVPLLLYSIQHLIGWWPADDPGSYTNYHPKINGSWVVMEVGTIIAGLIAIRCWPFPFIMAPIAHALWFMSMDGAELLLGEHYHEWEQRLTVSAAFGAVMLLIAYLVDLRNFKADYAFWLYLFGVMALSGSLSMMHSGNEFHALLYALLHLALMIVAIALKRRALMVFGALGVFGYLGHLAHSLFKDSILFPFALCGLGLALIASGIWYQKNRKRIEALLSQSMLYQLSSWIPARALSDQA